MEGSSALRCWFGPHPIFVVLVLPAGGPGAQSYSFTRTSYLQGTVRLVDGLSECLSDVFEGIYGEGDVLSDVGQFSG